MIELRHYSDMENPVVCTDIGAISDAEFLGGYISSVNIKTVDGVFQAGFDKMNVALGAGLYPLFCIEWNADAKIKLENSPYAFPKELEDKLNSRNGGETFLCLDPRVMYLCISARLFGAKEGEHMYVPTKKEAYEWLLKGGASMDCAEPDEFICGLEKCERIVGKLKLQGQINKK